MLNNLFNPLRHWAEQPNLLPSFDEVDSVLDREDSLSERYAFQLGEDIGICRLSPLEEWPHAEMQRGYQQGLRRDARRAGVHLRKLLYTRCNALARGIPVSSALTVDYLKQIAVVACPVSGVSLTRGTMTDSDWSVDRLDNSLGYVPGNVCIVSARVNRLKDTADFSEMTSAARDAILTGQDLDADLGNGLRVIEAFRIAALMAAPSGYARGQIARYTPFASAPQTWTTPDSAVAMMHVACASTRIEGAAYARRANLFKKMGRESWQASNRLVSRIREGLARNTHPGDIWFIGDSASLLSQLTDEVMTNPPVIPGIDGDTLARGIQHNLQPLSQYLR